MGFFIRTATQEDYEHLCEAFAEGDAHHRKDLPQVFREPDGSVRTREFISAILSDENATLLVADHDGQIIGLVHILLRETPDISVMVPRRYAVIDNLVVAKRFRRSGVGQLLMQKAHQWAVSRGVVEVELNVWEFNQGAIAFYEKLGYTTASRRMWKSLG